MAQLRDDYDEFEALKTLVVVVGPERPESFRSYWEENQMPFMGLPDPGHSVLELYGQEVNLFKLGRMPAMVIIDQAGIVRYAHYGKSMADIPANQDVLGTLKSLDEGMIE